MPTFVLTLNFFHVRACLFPFILFPAKLSGRGGGEGGGRKVKGGSINYRVFHSLTVLPVTSAGSDGIARFKWPQPFFIFYLFLFTFTRPWNKTEIN